MKKKSKFLYRFSWYRILFPEAYWARINRIWYKLLDDPTVQHLDLPTGDVLEKILGPGISNWLYCIKQGCSNILNYTDSWRGQCVEPNGDMVDEYCCSACVTKQRYVLDIVAIPVPLQTRSYLPGENLTDYERWLMTSKVKSICPDCLNTLIRIDKPNANLLCKECFAHFNLHTTMLVVRCTNSVIPSLMKK